MPPKMQSRSSNQSAFDFEATTPRAADDRLPWVPSSAVAHVAGLTKSLEHLGQTRLQIIAAYRAEIQHLQSD